MAYSVTRILCNVTTAAVYKGASLAGFPAGNFNYLLYSVWVCLGPNDSSGDTPRRVLGWANTVVWGSIDINHDQVTAFFRTGVSQPVIFNGSFKYAPGNVLTHLIVSISPTNQVIQVYVNDTPLTLTGGGWTGSGSFNLDGHFSQWELDSAGSAAPGTGAGDLLCAAPASFYDLSIVANRRKFINADLTPVDLGVNAASVLGSPPSIYLTARSGVATDFANNNGFGGAFTYFSSHVPTLQDPGSCVVTTTPPPEPGPGPGPPTPPPTGGPYLREMTYRRRFLGQSFDPTLVITKDRPGPLRIVELDFWMN